MEKFPASFAEEIKHQREAKRNKNEAAPNKTVDRDEPCLFRFQNRILTLAGRKGVSTALARSDESPMRHQFTAFQCFAGRWPKSVAPMEVTASSSDGWIPFAHEACCRVSMRRVAFHRRMPRRTSLQQHHDSECSSTMRFGSDASMRGRRARMRS